MNKTNELVKFFESSEDDCRKMIQVLFETIKNSENQIEVPMLYDDEDCMPINLLETWQFNKESLPTEEQFASKMDTLIQKAIRFAQITKDKDEPERDLSDFTKEELDLFLPIDESNFNQDRLTYLYIEGCQNEEDSDYLEQYERYRDKVCDERIGGMAARLLYVRFSRLIRMHQLSTPKIIIENEKREVALAYFKNKYCIKEVSVEKMES